MECKSCTVISNSISSPPLCTTNFSFPPTLSSKMVSKGTNLVVTFPLIETNTSPSSRKLEAGPFGNTVSATSMPISVGKSSRTWVSVSGLRPRRRISSKGRWLWVFVKRVRPRQSGLKLAHLRHPLPLSLNRPSRHALALLHKLQRPLDTVQWEKVVCRGTGRAACLQTDGVAVNINDGRAGGAARGRGCRLVGHECGC